MKWKPDVLDRWTLVKMFVRITLVTLGLLGVLAGSALGFLAWCATFPGEPGRADVSPPIDEKLEERLEKHVREIAQPRSDSAPEGYALAENYLRLQLSQMGYEVHLQPVNSQSRVSQNIWVETEGSTEELIVIGAHYDGAFHTPGADDNASGTAVALEMARAFSGRETGPTVRFAFFANEEPPHFRSTSMGSDVMARSFVEDERKVRWMASLEMLGYFVDEPGSQNYPPVLNLFYPDRGNFVAFVSNLDSRNVNARLLGSFRESNGVPAYGFSGPTWVEGIDYSDHMPFWNAGYPALMITDTAFFRNPHYHEATDTPETLDYRRMTRVTQDLVRVLETEVSH